MLITYPVTKPKNLCAFCIFCIFRRSAAAAAVGTTSAGRFLRILRTIKLISADGKTTYFASTISCPQLSSACTCQSLGAIDFISRRVRQLPLLRVWTAATKQTDSYKYNGGDECVVVCALPPTIVSSLSLSSCRTFLSARSTRFTPLNPSSFGWG